MTVYRVTYQVVPKLPIQGLSNSHNGPEPRVWEQPDLSPCRSTWPFLDHVVCTQIFEVQPSTFVAPFSRGVPLISNTKEVVKEGEREIEAGREGGRPISTDWKREKGSEAAATN